MTRGDFLSTMALIYFVNVVVAWGGVYILARLLKIKSPAIHSLIVGLAFGAAVMAVYWILIS